MNQKQHLKPLYWGLFSVGGTVAALILAPLIASVCILLAFGILGSGENFYHSIHGFITHKFVFFILAGMVFTMLWHGCHRFYYILHDMHIRVDNRMRIGAYLFSIAAFVITLLFGWF